MTDSPSRAAPTIRFRGRSLMAIVLTPVPPLDTWLESFDAMLARSPAFFINKPVVLDVSGLPQKRPDLMGAVNELQARKVRVMALEGTDTSTLGADARGLPPILDARPAGAVEVEPKAIEEIPVKAGVAPPPRALSSLLIDKPVRSGQAIYCPEGDVTVLGSVASGAEIIAGGSIHVYGSLRGRALAGWGNRDGRIFCRHLDAELLAIDGLYKTADEIDSGLRGRPVQAWTRGDVLMVEALA